MPNASDMLAAAIQVIMAILGALARMLNRKQSLAIAHTLGDLFVAGFTGITLYWVSSSMSLESGWLFAASGIAGWAGPSVLDWLTGIVEKKTGIPFTSGDERNAAKPPGGGEDKG